MNALTLCTSSLMAVIPVFMARKRNPFFKENQKCLLPSASTASTRRFCAAMHLLELQLGLKVSGMKTVTMLAFRRSAKEILRRIGRGERFILSHRGRPAARLEPLKASAPKNGGNDPFLTIGSRALPSPKGKTDHTNIDRILYGGR